MIGYEVIVNLTESSLLGRQFFEHAYGEMALISCSLVGRPILTVVVLLPGLGVHSMEKRSWALAITHPLLSFPDSRCDVSSCFKLCCPDFPFRMDCALNKNKTILKLPLPECFYLSNRGETKSLIFYPLIYFCIF